MSTDNLIDLQTRSTPLSVLRTQRDRNIDILRTDLSWDWWTTDGDLDQYLTELANQEDLRCLSALQECAMLDLSGHNLRQLDATKKLCRMVAKRELQEYEMVMKEKRRLS